MSVLLLGTSPAAAQTEEIAIGDPMPTIEEPLQHVTGTGMVELDELTGSVGTAFIFWSNQCPWIDRYESRVRELVRTFSDEGVEFVLVNSNDATAFPQESLDSSRERAEDRDYQATYVRDPEARLANAFGAARTPQVFLFDENRSLVYTGTIDDSPADADAVRDHFFRDALSSLVEGEAIEESRTRPFGCTIKF